jgi:hypothetical protein
MNLVRDSWAFSHGDLASGQGRKLELILSKGYELAKVLFPPPHTYSWSVVCK